MPLESFLKNIRIKMSSRKSRSQASSIPIRQASSAQARKSSSKSSERSLVTSQSSMEVSSGQDNREVVEETIRGYTESVYTSSPHSGKRYKTEKTSQQSVGNVRGRSSRQSGRNADSNKAPAQSSIIYESVTSIPDEGMMIISEENLPLEQEDGYNNGSTQTRRDGVSSSSSRKSAQSSENRGGVVVERALETVSSNNRGHRESTESVHGSIKDSGYADSNQDLLSQDSGSEGYSETKMIKSVSFEALDSNKAWQHSQHELEFDMAEEDEEILKEELLRIFDRERSTLEHYYKHKMADYVQAHRRRQFEVEEQARVERGELEHELAHEKAEMQKCFAEEIAKLTRTFNDERAELEAYYKEQIKSIRSQYEKDQKDWDERLVKERVEIRGRVEEEFQAKMRAELSDSKYHAKRTISDMEEKHTRERSEIEKKHRVELEEIEIRMQKLTSEFQTLTREKEEWKGQVQVLQERLNKETEYRSEVERLLDQEKLNVTNIEMVKRKETEELKSELENARVELDDRNKSTLEFKKMEEDLRVKGKDGLSGHLREEFEKIMNEHKRKLDQDYEQEKENLRLNVESQRKKIEEDIKYERQKLKEENDRERDEISREKKEVDNEKYRVSKVKEAVGSSYHTGHSASYGEHRPRDSSRNKDGNSYSRDNAGQSDIGNDRPSIDKRRNDDQGIKEEHILAWDSNFMDYPQEGNRYGRDDREDAMIHENISYINASRTGDEGQQRRDDKRDGRMDGRKSYPEEHHATDRRDEQRYGNSNDSRRDEKFTYQRRDGRQGEYRNADARTGTSYGPYESQRSSDINRNVTNESRRDYSVTTESKQYYVNAENEETLRSEINELRRENEGLKAKIEAMEENINLHKTYKTEAKDEIARLQKATNDLKEELEAQGKAKYDLEAAKEKTQKLESNLKDNNDKIKELEKKLQDVTSKLKDAESKASDEEKRALELKNKLDISNKKSTKYEGVEEGENSVARPQRVSAGSAIRHSTPRYQNQDKTAIKEESLYETNADSYTYSEPERKAPVSDYSMKVGPEQGYTGHRADFAERRTYETKQDPHGSQGDKHHKTSYERYDSFDVQKPQPSDDFNSSRYFDTHPSYKQEYPVETTLPRCTQQKTDYKTGSKSTQLGRSSHYSTRPDAANKGNSGFSRYNSLDTGLDRIGGRESKTDGLTTSDRFSAYGPVLSGSHTLELKKNKKLDWKHGSEARQLDLMAAEKKSKYEKTLNERNKLLQLIKELQQRVRELEAKNSRTSTERALGGFSSITGASRSSHMTHDKSALAKLIHELQVKMRELLDALQQEKTSSLEAEFTTGNKSQYVQGIEGMQHRLQHTDNVINGSHGNIDADVLRKIEKEISAIGSFVRSHMTADEGQLTNRAMLSNQFEQFENRDEQFDKSSDETVKMLHLQMEKQELEMKLSMAKEAMSEYVLKLNDKIDDLRADASMGSGISDATLRELYERNSKLKQTLESLEQGQMRSLHQNEQLRKQTSDMQNLIGQLTEDMKGCSPRHHVRGATNGDGCYTMTSHFQYNTLGSESRDGFLSRDESLRDLT
ncbi:centromere-associated protein E isoform X2 [Nematostella vectensis]|uniref:centromere-associated protein E isoform X2 n=1 Tax=Nematostella vectensis TaxID=45351 RepID=UPI0020777121|nr:centromere-associated protein E isoform X2 [Nematostella vectensis]